MRIALISDLHGCALALEQVLSRVASQGVDQIVCLGDVATLGPEPERLIALLEATGATCILGNHDEFLLRPELVAEYTTIPVLVDSIDWCRSQLSSASIDYIRTFLPSYTLPLNGSESLFAFHGTPTSNTTDLLAITDAATVEEWVGGFAGSVLAGGH